ncbi:MAG: hypothetical protein WC333_09590 [Dehalococcoidia bacterium]|jgi:hypothetical protein
MTKKKTVKAIEVEFEIVEIKSMADKSTNVKINLPEYCQSQALEMLRHVKELAKAVIQFSDES